MEYRFLLLGLVLTFGPFAAGLADEQADAIPYVGAEAGLAIVVCQYNDGPFLPNRRGALIETAEAEATFELVLTAAHGLPATATGGGQTCALDAGDDRYLPVVEIFRAETQGREADDWAVLLVDGRLEGAVKRLMPVPLEQTEVQQLLSDDVTARLPLRFPPGERPCGLMQSKRSDADVEAGLFAHNCRAWQGHSGSPIVANLQQGAFLLGVHLGNRWIAEDRAALEVGRYVDADVTAAIAAAMARGRVLANESRDARSNWLQRLIGD
jgi:hypothetical protein